MISISTPGHPAYFLVVAAILRALYPILIKSLPTSLFTQTYLRFFAFIIPLSLYFYISTKRLMPSLQTNEIPKAVLYPATLQIIHILTSYISFYILSPGVAITIFYIYPIFTNLLSPLYNPADQISTKSYIYLAACLLGVLFIQGPDLFSIKGNSKLLFAGVLCALLAAFTESLITLYQKYQVSSERTPLEIIYLIHLGGFVLLSFISPWFIQLSPLRATSIILLFNVTVGILSFYLHLVSIRAMKVIHFSSIMYIGVIFAYLFGYLFYRTPIHWYHLVGTGIIFYAIRQILENGTVESKNEH